MATSPGVDAMAAAGVGAGQFMQLIRMLFDFLKAHPELWSALLALLTDFMQQHGHTPAPAA